MAEWIELIFGIGAVAAEPCRDTEFRGN